MVKGIPGLLLLAALSFATESASAARDIPTSVLNQEQPVFAVWLHDAHSRPASSKLDSKTLAVAGFEDGTLVVGQPLRCFTVEEFHSLFRQAKANHAQGKREELALRTLDSSLLPTEFYLLCLDPDRISAIRDGVQALITPDGIEGGCPRAKPVHVSHVIITFLQEDGSYAAVESEYLRAASTPCASEHYAEFDQVLAYIQSEVETAKLDQPVTMTAMNLAKKPPRETGISPADPVSTGKVDSPSDEVEN